jgi:flavin reductase (DIM6/NTAB) family NADH-FMN oxidoreductase RutF
VSDDVPRAGASASPSEVPPTAGTTPAVSARTAPAEVTGDPRDPTVFRAVLGRFATGVTVMTSVLDGTAHGMTANAVTSVSLDPPLVLVCVERGSVMAAHVEGSGVFALSVLTAHQVALSVAFADPDRPKGAAQFAGLETHTAVTGAPLLGGAIGHLDCRVWAVHDGGDHRIVVGEVVALSAGGPDEPLLYYRGGYGRWSPEEG